MRSSLCVPSSWASWFCNKFVGDLGDPFGIKDRSYLTGRKVQLADGKFTAHFFK